MVSRILLVNEVFDEFSTYISAAMLVDKIDGFCKDSVDILVEFLSQNNAALCPKAYNKFHSTRPEV